MDMEKAKIICVTGAGGFVASWIVKLFLSKGYIVHGTVRDLNDKKYAFLNALEGAPDNLKLFKADLLDYDSLRLAIKGCGGVIHVACPVPSSTIGNPEVEMLQPAIKGTLNVLRASSEAKVKRVVYISSIVAVLMNPNWPEDRAKDETCWSDKEYCTVTENWYCLAKTEAETIASEYGKQNGLDVVSVNPGYVFGPLLQPVLNYSTLLLSNFVKGIYSPIIQEEGNSVPNKIWNLVDVRDVADAVLLAYEHPKAEGRYICVSENITTEDWVNVLKSMYPNFTYFNEFSESPMNYLMTSEKLQNLGWKYRPLKEIFADSIESYLEAAILS